MPSVQTQPTSRKEKGLQSKAKSKAKSKSKSEPDTHRCFHCQSEGTNYQRCSQCHMAWYCQKSCQKLHWKHHKRACVAAVAAKAKRATMAREATAAREGAGDGAHEVCVICADEPIKDPVEVRGVWALRHVRLSVRARPSSSHHPTHLHHPPP